MAATSCIYCGTALMTTRNHSYSQDSAGTAEIALEGKGTLTWTAAASLLPLWERELHAISRT